MAVLEFGNAISRMGSGGRPCLFLESFCGFPGVLLEGEAGKPQLRETTVYAVDTHHSASNLCQY